MSALRKIIYTLLATVVLFVAVGNSVLDISYSLFFIICAALGIFIAHVYRELEPADDWDRVSLIYLPIAGITICISTISNFIVFVLGQQMGRIQNLATPSLAAEAIKNTMESTVSTLTSMIHFRALPIELLLLTTGILGPLIISEHYRKQQIPWADVLWDIFIVIVLYSIAFFIEHIVISQIIMVAT